MRFLVWIALIVLVISALRVQIKRAVKKNIRQNDEIDVEPIISCAKCGVHFPASEAVSEAGAVFCSDEHRRMYFS